MVFYKSGKGSLGHGWATWVSGSRGQVP